ncbi:MAG TPA: adenine deaminase, partial [Symbiobacteriaceae bacterium]|nr:adenine deaminase [Symbiobacteriaceae bacterium]
MAMTPAERSALVDVAAGRRPGTLLLRNARLLNLLSGEIYPTEILLHGRWIAAVGEGYQAEATLDLGGRFVAPGLIDGHLHLESAMVAPAEYARAVVPRGVTSVVADPHEIANVLGLAGIEYMLEATEGLPLDVFLTASSCVPATTLETAGASLGLAEIEHLLLHSRIVGVAELMNFPGIVAGAPTELAKIDLAERYSKVADGHAPLLSGTGLNAYFAAGVGSDHEVSSVHEGQEKLRRGAHLMIREGSAARNLDALLPLLNAQTADRISFVTDDREPPDLIADGGVDHLVRRALAAGVSPLLALRAGSLSTARYFGLGRRGAIAPGWLADLVVLEDLTGFRAAMVFKSGELVAQDGRLLQELPTADDSSVRGTVKLPALPPDAFAIPYEGGLVRAIGLVPGELLTRALAVEPAVQGGRIVANAARDLVKMAVIERHGKGGGIGLGLLQGLGLQRGALASTVGHDSHNLILVGADDADMRLAAETVASMEGGFAVVAGGEVLAKLPLPLAGLMSDRPLSEVAAGLKHLEAAARELGVTIASPFMALSFLALPVIPRLKLTDKGLVLLDGERMELVSL